MNTILRPVSRPKFFVAWLLLVTFLAGCATVPGPVHRVGNTVESGVERVEQNTRSLWNRLFGRKSVPASSRRGSASSRPVPAAPPPTLENRPQDSVGR